MNLGEAQFFNTPKGKKRIKLVLNYLPNDEVVCFKIKQITC